MLATVLQVVLQYTGTQDADSSNMMVEFELACASWKNYCALCLYCNLWITSQCFVHYYDGTVYDAWKTFIRESKFRSIAKFTADEVTRGETLTYL